MRKLIEVIPGQRYGKLKVVLESEPEFKIYKDGRKRKVRMVSCSCDCGKSSRHELSKLRSGHTTSCGCKVAEACSNTGKSKIHGRAGTRIYSLWVGMHARCYNQKNKRYERYGARGIKVCSEWHDVEAFCQWAETNGSEKGLQLDRIDNDLDYCPENCRFVTAKENCANRSNSSKWKVGQKSFASIREISSYLGVSTHAFQSDFNSSNTHNVKRIYNYVERKENLAQ